MNRSKLMNYTERFGLAATLIVFACLLQRRQVFAQQSPAPTQKTSGARMAEEKAHSTASAAREMSEDDQFFKGIYHEFYNTYRLGPADEIAIRVTGQPDYTLERVKVSPIGGVYHPLLGDVEVVGMTVPQLIKRLTGDLSEYLIDPKVSVSLSSASSRERPTRRKTSLCGPATP